MDSGITVVSVELNDIHSAWVVTFSEPVYLRKYVEPSTRWLAEGDDGYVARHIDALDAYLWGLKLIEKHKERVNAQR